MNPELRDVAREVRYALRDPRALCERLGLLAGKNSFARQAGGVIVRCPWHAENTPSCSVRVARDGTIAVKCHGCQESGDALSLVAAVHKLSIRGDFLEVLSTAAELAGRHDLLDAITTGTAPQRREVPPQTPVEPERDYPPLDEVRALWETATGLDGDEQAVDWASARGLNAYALDGSEVVRALSPRTKLPSWARYQGATWVETGHRLVVPMFDATGAMRSVRACRIVDGESPKRLPPAGHKASALVMLCPLGVALFRGTFSASRVVISEGEPDFLLWASETGIAATVRVGIVSGSWTTPIAMRFAPGVEVAVRTDPDDAGDRYAKEIGASLQRRGCHVRREPRQEAA